MASATAVAKWRDDALICADTSVAATDAAADNAVQALYDIYAPTGGLLAIKTFVNLDASDENRPVPNGVVTVHPVGAPVHPDSVVNFEHIMVFPVSVVGRKLTDADFTSDEVRARLDEAVPQYSSRPPSLTLRNRIDNGDLDAWQHELGQDRAFAGIYKRLAPNGRDYKYEIHVMAGADNVARELRTWVNQQPVDKRMTWGAFLDSDEASYARSAAENNAKRIGYAVARACRVSVASSVDSMSKPDDARATRAEPSISQPLSSIEHCVFPQHQAVAVYSGVTPASYCGAAASGCGGSFLTVGNAYDPAIVFNMAHGAPTDPMGMPAVAARIPLAGPAGGGGTEARELAERMSHLIWESPAGTIGASASGPAAFGGEAHPDAHPDAFQSIKSAVFMDAMAQHGWDRKAHFDQAVPVLVKVSNPALRRP